MQEDELIIESDDEDESRIVYKQMARILDFQADTWSLNPWGRFTACSIRIQGTFLDMKVVSTMGKDRKFVNTCRTEFAYLVWPWKQTSRKPDEVDDSWFEATRATSCQYDFDAIDDIPADGAPVTLFELFSSKKDSVALVLQAVATTSELKAEEASYRRIGICTIRARCLLNAAQKEIVLL